MKLARVDQRFKIVVRDHNGEVYGADLETTEVEDAVAEPVEIYVYNIRTGATFHKYVLPNRAITPDAYETHELDLEKLRARGAEPKLDWENDKPTVMALREIAESLVLPSNVDSLVKPPEEPAAEAEAEADALPPETE